jgi:hypothetical protein
MPAVKAPARPTMSQPAVREMVEEARELIGRDVEAGLAPVFPLTVGSDATVASAGGGTPAFAGAEAGADAGAGAGEIAPLRAGTLFSVALAQFALYPSRDLAAVGLTANAIPL